MAKEVVEMRRLEENRQRKRGRGLADLGGLIFWSFCLFVWLVMLKKSSHFFVVVVPILRVPCERAILALSFVWLVIVMRRWDVWLVLS